MNPTLDPQRTWGWQEGQELLSSPGAPEDIDLSLYEDTVLHLVKNIFNGMTGVVS